MGKFEENKEKLIEYYELNLTNRQIAEKIGVHHSSVGTWLRKLGLVNKFKSRPLEKINEFEAKCSKCGEIKPIDEFQVNRRNSIGEYTFSYCNNCRKRQNYTNLNSNIEKYLKNNFNKLKKRAEKNSIPFNLTFEYVMELYNIQNGKCFYSEKEMTWGVDKGLQTSVISFDKIVPEIGYTIGNIVLCQFRFNSIKSNLNLEELKAYIPYFYNKLLNSSQVTSLNEKL